MPMQQRRADCPQAARQVVEPHLAELAGARARGVPAVDGQLKDFLLDVDEAGLLEPAADQRRARELPLGYPRGRLEGQRQLLR